MDGCVDVDDNSSYTLFIRIGNSLKHCFENSNSLILCNSVQQPYISERIHFSMIKTGDPQTEESLLCSSSSL